MRNKQRKLFLVFVLPFKIINFSVDKSVIVLKYN